MNNLTRIILGCSALSGAGLFYYLFCSEKPVDMKHLTPQDLDNLISEKLKDCQGYDQVCRLLETAEGTKRIKDRIKQLIKDDGISSIGSCLAQIESELIMDV